MNILLVDDDAYLVEAIRTMVNWEALGIEGVYTANLAVTAKRILEEEEIDLMLCDVEMPRENGLELIDWCRKQGIDVATVILSSQARFEYARKAIELESYDYLLKPVSYPELTEKLSETIGKLLEKREQERYSKVGRQSGVALRTLFWKWFLYGTEPEKELETAFSDWLTAKKAETEESGRYYMILFDSVEYQTALEKEERGMTEYTLREMLRRVSEQTPFALQTVFRTASRDLARHVAVFRREQACSAEELTQFARKVEAEAGDKLFRHCRCFVGEGVGLPELPEQRRQLYRMMEDTISGKEQLYFLETYIWKKLPYVEPAFEEWKRMILAGSGGQAAEEIGRYLDDQTEEEGLNAQVVRCFLLHFQYMLYEALRERQVLIQYLDEDMNRETYPDRHFSSVPALKQYVNDVMEAACRLIEPVTESNSVIQKLVSYIDEHLGEELNRDSFAEVVYLNPNYMARLFKNEMGVSLGSYLISRRVEKAKELLRYTDIPINSVSLQVGYDNFSYFSKLFRKIEGCTPNEYRKQYKTDGKSV